MMKTIATLVALAMASATPAASSREDDMHAIAALDTAYQAAVEANDADTMATILHPEMVLILGDGRIVTREDLLRTSRARTISYERQVEVEGTQRVRMFGPNTGVVTALLLIRGTRDGQIFERRLWFSDTYVRTAEGWRYALGQASLALPAG